ncbi:hypothetical protein PM082_018935 [Marasmius tenuissimus]|nr:hypothetical protein PM082_018935 [Marasmius tenuissimus]
MPFAAGLVQEMIQLELVVSLLSKETKALSSVLGHNHSLTAPGRVIFKFQPESPIIPVGNSWALRDFAFLLSYLSYQGRNTTL